MIEGIIQAISIALDAEFGESYKIYPELTEQELSKLCFFVYCLETSCNVYRGNRYFSKNTFVIQYFPYSSDIEMECNRVAERLFSCLELITCPEESMPISGAKMNAKIEDGRLFFKVNYDLFLIKGEYAVPMEILEQEIGNRKNNMTEN